MSLRMKSNSLCNQRPMSLYLIQHYYLLQAPQREWGVFTYSPHLEWKATVANKGLWVSTWFNIINSYKLLRYAKTTSTYCLCIFSSFHLEILQATLINYVCLNETVDIRSFCTAPFKTVITSIFPFPFFCLLHLHSTCSYYITYSLTQLIVCLPPLKDKSIRAEFFFIWFFPYLLCLEIFMSHSRCLFISVEWKGSLFYKAMIKASQSIKNNLWYLISVF